MGFWCHVRLYRNSRTADLGNWSQCEHLRSSRHRYYLFSVGGQSFVWSFLRLPDGSFMTPWTRIFRVTSSSRTTNLPRFSISSRMQWSSGNEKLWNFIQSFPSKDRIVLTADLNPLAVDGTTINFSPFCSSDWSQFKSPTTKTRRQVCH